MVVIYMPFSKCLSLTHWGRDKMAAIFQTHSNAFSLYENVRISLKISLKFVPKGPINNCPSLVQMMDWRRPGDKPLSEPMMGRLLMHICITRPQGVKDLYKMAHVGVWWLQINTLGPDIKWPPFSNAFFLIKMYEFQLRFHLTCFRMNFN